MSGEELRRAAAEVVALLTTSGKEPPPLNDYGLLSTLHFYAGPNARTAVDPAKAARVTALSDATRRLSAALRTPDELHPLDSGLDHERLARALCASREPLPEDVGYTAADIHVDDECRMQAHRIADIYDALALHKQDATEEARR